MNQPLRTIETAARPPARSDVVVIGGGIASPTGASIIIMPDRLRVTPSLTTSANRIECGLPPIVSPNETSSAVAAWPATPGTTRSAPTCSRPEA